MVFQVNVREVGERRRLEEQVRRAEKLSALGRLVAGVAHELNNPLAIIMGNAQLLAGRNHLDDPLKEGLGRILRQSERASRIIRDLLAYSRPSQPSLLEWLVANVGIWIKRLGDAGGQLVNLDPGDSRVGVHLFRHQPDEVAQSAGRLQNASIRETETREGSVHSANDDRRRVVGVECRGAGGRVFLVRQKFGQFNLLLEPLARVDIEDLRQPAPTNVPHEHRLLVVRGRRFVGFEAAQEFDRLDVGPELLFE